jgi:predicted DNA-binding helix-hairpin-helix protein
MRKSKEHALNVFYPASPNGASFPVLKTLLTSACERDCFYCPFRAGRDYRRTTLRPHEMAQAFMAMHSAGIVKGLFLSSGIAGGGMRTQDLLIDTAEILRCKYEFKGYIHLKIMPGAEPAQVERLMQLADRISINLEAPNPHRLERLAPSKDFLHELIQPLRWASEIRKNASPQGAFNRRWPSLTTQFVVGAVGESDLELLQTTEHLYHDLGLQRSYFSAFNPVPGTPLEDLPPASHLRQQRLYQASFLLRDYGFGLEDLPFEETGDLPLGEDPKLAWARTNLAEKPVEINRADQPTLLRIPGIGPKGAREIIHARRQGKIRQSADLRRLGVQVERALPYILIDGRQPNQQLSLWPGL